MPHATRHEDTEHVQTNSANLGRMERPITAKPPAVSGSLLIITGFCGLSRALWIFWATAFTFLDEYSRFRYLEAFDEFSIYTTTQFLKHVGQAFSLCHRMCPNGQWLRVYQPAELESYQGTTLYSLADF